MLKSNLQTELQSFKKKIDKERRVYVEDYMEQSFDNFPEFVPFSDNERDLENLKQDMWLVCGEVALASDNAELQTVFVRHARDGNILKHSE